MIFFFLNKKNKKNNFFGITRTILSNRGKRRSRMRNTKKTKGEATNKMIEAEEERNI